jgi:tetratricopeptide (TPR) repeat protein
MRRSVMISSTVKDLPEHREEVRAACLRADCDPREMMENLPAHDAHAIDVSLKMVEAADIYIGILAYRYSEPPQGHDISITEMEYNKAVELKKPILCFFIHEDHPVTRKDVDTGPGAAKLEALKQRIGKERVVAFFKSPAELRAEVVAALTKLGKTLDAVGPGDAVAAAAAKLHRKSAIPAPPTPYVAHPYTLLQLPGLVGRQAELNALTDWVADPVSRVRIFCVVAIGGMGKSALAWKWFNDIAPQEMKPLAGRLWWSFYESDATFDNFLDRALVYVSDESEEAVRALPRPDREAQLLAALDERPFLLVLDGLERILIAYNRMDASSLADDDYDQQTANRVAGAIGLPASAGQSFVGQHRLRQTTDPRAGAFLQKLAMVKKSRILISSRLYPSELQLPTGYPRPGCFAYFLRGLSDDDALALWRGLGVSGARQELVPIFRSVGNHPLLIQALAGEVGNYRKAPGDFAAWRAEHRNFDPASLPLVQSRTHFLALALKGLDERNSEVLRTLVGFRMPASYATLEALLVGEGKACAAAPELDRALSELEDRGLIGWDREANRYDAHPIVRGVVWQLADAKSQRAIYAALAAHFEPMATPEWEKVESLADLAPAIERYHTLVGLGRYDEAFTLFRDRLDEATLYRLAAHRERIAWLERLFPDGPAGSPALTSERDQSYTLNALAQSYQISGQPGRAVPLFRRADQIYERRADDNHRQIVLSNLGDALFEIGAFREAESVLRQALVLNRKLEDKFWEADTLRNLGRVLTAPSDAVSSIVLGRSRRLHASLDDRQGESVFTAYLAERSLWRGEFAEAAAYADQAWELAAVQRVERDFVDAALRQGQAALGLGDITRADERLHHALTRARAVNLVEFELAALISLAELELRRGTAEAKPRLADVWEAAELGPYPLQQTDAFNIFAAIARAEGDAPAAIDAATKAYRAAWCDGPPYAYHWGLEKAKAHLAALGAAEPPLPPFDESKFAPMPEVEINPKDKNWVDPAALE